MLSRLRLTAVLSSLLVAISTYGGPPYITGTIDDNESIPIEMPRLHGNWQRSVVWLAPEGSLVQAGDLIARLDRGDLVELEEQTRVAVEEQRLFHESEIAQHKVNILDAETELFMAHSQLAIAKIDAAIPLTVATALDHENAQLAHENAENRVARAESGVINAKQKLDEFLPVSRRKDANLAADLAELQAALEAVDIYAARSGIMIHGENPMSGTKIFPGETLTPGDLIATIANQDELQFVFWLHDIDRLKFEEGTKLIVTPDALPSESVEAEVYFIANYAIERDSWSSGGYFKLIARPLSTLPSSFLPGMAVVGEVGT